MGFYRERKFVQVIENMKDEVNETMWWALHLWPLVTGTIMWVKRK